MRRCCSIAASRPQVLRLGTSARTLTASSSSPGGLPAKQFRTGARGVHLPWQQSGAVRSGVIRLRSSVPLGGALAGRAWQPPATVLIRVYSTPKSAAEDDDKASQGNVNPPTTATANVEATTSSTRVLTIPNILTVSRMIASPFIGYWIIQEEFALAMGWFLAASATDAVDGFIAKRFNQKSVVGSFLDPLADKLLMTIMVTTMAYKALLPLPLVGLILLRDVSLLAGGVIRRYRSLPRPVTVSRFFSVSKVESIEIKPTVISKVNTVLQVGLVFLVLSAKGLDFTLDPMFMSGLEWSVAGTTLFSGLDYLNSNAMQRIKTFQDRLTKRDP